MEEATAPHTYARSTGSNVSAIGSFRLRLRVGHASTKALACNFGIPKYILALPYLKVFSKILTQIQRRWSNVLARDLRCPSHALQINNHVNV